MQTQKHRAEAHLSSTLAHQVDFSDFGDGDGIDSTVIFFLFGCLFERTTAVMGQLAGTRPNILS